jgi:DNA-binding MarR family transcriptional regulator
VGVVTQARLEEAPFPALLRAARRSYGIAIRRALLGAGCEDLPPNGPYVVGAVARSGVPLSEVIDGLGVSKQAVGHLVDTLVARGYLDRSADPEDGRRLVVTLTERGHTAATTVRAAVDQVDAQLDAAVGAEYVAHTRATLAALLMTENGERPQGRHE